MLKWKEAKYILQREYLGKLLSSCSGNMSEAARLAGVYRADLYGMLRKAGMSTKEFRDTPGELVYFIQSDNGLIKIGRASDVAARLKGLQTGNAGELTLLASTAGYNEAELHIKFNQYRVRGEWFTPVPEIMDFIETVKLV